MCAERKGKQTNRKQTKIDIYILGFVLHVAYAHITVVVLVCFSVTSAVSYFVINAL